MRTLRINRVPHSLWTNPLHFIACGFGAGAMPILPGTFGTLVGVVFYLLLKSLPLWFYCVVVIVGFLLGIGLCGKTNRDWGLTDHPAAVWDEIIGFLFVMIAIPPRWYFILMGFILFRIFDIWKPWPIHWIEKRLSLGLAIMADDVLAAFYAWVVLWVMHYWLS